MTQNVDRETVVSRLLAADDILILCHKNPDGDTIGRFRNLLIQNHIHEQFFAVVVKTLTDRGLILKICAFF